MRKFSRIFANTANLGGTLGVLTAALGCSACFPALGSLALLLGLGFLAQFEGLFINALLPLFAGLAIIVNLLSFIAHRRMLRLLAGIAGPIMILLTLYPLWSYNWSTYLFYSGLVMMVVASVLDIVFPPARRCSVEPQVNK